MFEQSFTLEQLAEAFDLTPRNARYWIENILPPHHKKGRGKVALYGRDTYNCFAFVQRAREEKLTSALIARVLAELDQEQIDRIAEGAEDLTVFPLLSDSFMEENAGPPPAIAASKRARRYISTSEDMLESAFTPEKAKFRRMSNAEKPSWQTLYSDDDLQIRHRGEADRSQREQVEKAAELIKSILKK